MNDEVVTDWRVATYTGGQDNCVEVGRSATGKRPGAALRSFRVAHVHAVSQGLALPVNRPPFEGTTTRTGVFACLLPIVSLQ